MTREQLIALAAKMRQAREAVEALTGIDRSNMSDEELVEHDVEVALAYRRFTRAETTYRAAVEEYANAQDDE